MASGTDSTAKPGEDWVVIASFDSHRRGELMLAKLGRCFRAKAREGRVTAIVVTENADGSLKLTQSRAVTGSGFVGTLIRLPLVWWIGFLGLFGAVKGVRGGIHAAEMRQGHVGSNEYQAHQILGETGPRSAIVLVRSSDSETRQAVLAAAEADARRSWDGSLTEFLAALDPGPPHDWVRTALGEPPRGTDAES